MQGVAGRGQQADATLVAGATNVAPSQPWEESVIPLGLVLSHVGHEGGDAEILWCGFLDAPAMQALDLYCEEIKTAQGKKALQGKPRAYPALSPGPQCAAAGAMF